MDTGDETTEFVDDATQREWDGLMAEDLRLQQRLDALTLGYETARDIISDQLYITQNKITNIARANRGKTVRLREPAAQQAE